MSDITEQLAYLRFHPLNEVSAVAYMLIKQLAEKYPASCPPNSMREDDIKFIKANADKFFYFDNAALSDDGGLLDYHSSQDGTFDVSYSNYDCMRYHDYWNGALEDRPRGVKIPRTPIDTGIQISHLIDYGSFRDIQRHRNCVQRIPLLTLEKGFEPWYVENMPESIHQDVSDHLDTVAQEIEVLEDEYDLNKYQLQYYIPMGYRVHNGINLTIAQAVYMAELRSSPHVHPTARKFAHNLADFLETYYGFVKIYPDRSESVWNVNRGKHTITQG